MKNVFVKLLALFIIGFGSAFAQSDEAVYSVTDTLIVTSLNEYSIGTIILPGSERIILNDTQLSKDGYAVNYTGGTFSLTDTTMASPGDTLYIIYNTVLTPLKKEYKRRSLVIKYDEAGFDSIQIIREEETSFSTEAIFGRDINKSGTILRGFTVGTNKDFTVNSGLRLQMSGRLSDEIEIVAALTDENTPIQPEGNTERIEELDKVFIEARHPNAVGTFGDYDFKQNIGEFGRIDRKLQGLKGKFIFQANEATIAVAGSRGKFNTNSFNGTDGVQGPYRLYGQNNERSIVIIAGSERVYLDGEEMQRGENRDYVIEYSNAEITFTPNRLITSASRIVVDFEYTDNEYNRNFFSTNAKAGLLNDRINFTINYYREGDDENNPIDAVLSDAELDIIKAAGDDRNNAIVDGATLAQPDSTGEIKGIYTKVDTVINDEPFSYYRYDPGRNSLYNVSFSFVGEGSGDYAKESLGHYRFVGIGQGSYLPIKYLPLPQLRQMANIVVNTKLWEGVRLNLELAGSDWDKNTLSDTDDDNNTGYARNLLLDITPRKIKLGGLNLGKAGLTYKDRFIENRFTSLDRIDDLEFDRYYNAVNNNNNEELRELDLMLQPVEELSVKSKYGFLKKGSTFESNRYYTDVNLTQESSINLNYELDYVNSTNANLKTDWMRQSGDVFYLIDRFRPGVEFLYEKREDNFASNDSLITGSLQYNEYTPYLQVVDLAGFGATFKYSYRKEEFPLNGRLTKQSDAALRSINLNYRGIKEISSELSLTFRNKDYTEEFKQLGFTDNETILIRSQTRYNFGRRFIYGDLYYQAATERTARLERVFVRVEKGTGNYKYLGDLNNNGIADEDEFELVAFDGDYIIVTIPTDELFPTIDLRTNLRFTVDLSKQFKGYGFWDKTLAALSTETVWRVEENSKETDTKKIYLLEFDSFLNDSTTIQGSNFFQHDFHVFRNERDFSMRFRYIQRKSLNNFSTGLERSYFRERSVRINFNLVKEINNQTEFINQTDFVSSPVTTNRARRLSSNQLSTDFSYRPEREIEAGFRVKTGRIEDTYPDDPTVVDNNEQLIWFTYFFSGKGRLRLEAERKEFVANASVNSLPFEITNGNSIGKNYLWRLNFDYRISANLQSTISYNGRKLGEGDVIHTMRAEARAFF